MNRFQIFLKDIQILLNNHRPIGQHILILPIFNLMLKYEKIQESRS